MTIFARSPPTGWPRMAYGPMSYAAVSHARTSASPGRAPGSGASDPVSGANMLGSLARYDRDTSLWKTSQLCLDGGLETFSETWPRSGMMRSGTAYRLPPLVRLTKGTASGLWPTLHGMGQDGHGSELSMAARVSLGLSDSERSKAKTPRSMWPTPRVEPGNFSRVNGKIYETSLPSMARRGLLAEPYVPRQHWPTPLACSAMAATITPEAIAKAAGRRPNLETVVAMRTRPTPTSEDGESKGMSMKRLATRAPDNLATAVRFPSPANRDWRSGKGRSENGHTPQLPEQVGGQLNPDWVEALMGLPVTWTKVG